jgi:UDP-4-amino-4-deoxy-L-arabinose formyltransferase / UDP-glucuronic acid dehydrogenase (UDP-4-keto-hexauronic acid decarboxylating)
MRVLFIGSKDMGVLALDELVRQKAELVGIVARWDDPTPNQWYKSVALRGKQLGVPTLQPRNINDPEVVSWVMKLRPDVMFTAFYPTIYKPALLNIPPAGSYNLHYAPLPRYRGSFPGAWAIINGETRHGVTIHMMSPGVDNGDIVGQEMLAISPEDTGLSLYKKCDDAGVRLLRRLWPDIMSGKVTRTPQDHMKVIYHDRTFPYGGVVNFAWTATQVHNFVRAMTFPPFPNPFVFYKRRKFTVLRTIVIDQDLDAPAGTVQVSSDGLIVQTAKGCIKIVEVLDNRAVQRSIPELAAKYRMNSGDVLGR